MKEFLRNYIPDKRDNLKQITLKIVFLVCAFAILVSGIYFVDFYYTDVKETKVIIKQQEIIKNNNFKDGYLKLKRQNSDYQAWLELYNTELSYSVYKTDNNSFYLTNNALRQTSDNGTLFLDYRCNIVDKNRVIYGNSLENGKMFSLLNNLRVVNFYEQHSVLGITTDKGVENYKIYAVFVLNAKKEDDGDYIYNIYRNEFKTEKEFDSWCNEAKERSVITTDIDVDYGDNIITLVTSCTDFENARLVIMARSLHNGEDLNKLQKASANKNPKYPKKWYESRNIEYPFS